MKQKLLTKSLLLLTALLGGVCSAWGEGVTLAQWDFTTSVKYTGETTDNKTYYTASSDSYTQMEYTFTANQPFFYPTSGSQNTSTLTVMSTDTSKKWYISNYNSGALRMYTSTPTVITNPTLATQHYNYAEVSFSATGYKNIGFSFKMSGNNNNSIPVYVLVSTDGGTTWMIDAGSYTTGSSWSNFAETSTTLGVDNCSNVKVRALIGYNAGATSDMYMNNFKVTGEAIGDATTYTLATSSTDTSKGYVSMSKAGTSFVSGTSITLTPNKIGDALFSKWQDGNDTQVSTDNPYTFSISAATTLSAVFIDAVYYTLTTGVNIPWAGTITRSSDQDEYLSGTELTLTAAANTDYTFSQWSTGATTASINVTMDEAKNITAQFTKKQYDYGTDDTKIVSWTFDGDYDVATATYTPTGVGHANYSYTYSSQVPTIRPDYYTYGTDITSYALTLKCDNAQKWNLENFNNNGRYVLFFYNADDMETVTDYTDPSQQTNYFEASFPTSNFKNIKLSFCVCAHSEPTGMTYGVVYSTDNGSTWTSAGTITTGTHWNIWNSFNINLSTITAVNNQEKVIVRIVRQRSSKGENKVEGQNNKLDYFTVTGTVDTYEYLNESTSYTPTAITANVTLTRTLPADKWATIVLPFNVTVKQAKETFGNEVKLAQLTGINSDNMEFSSVDMTTDENATAMNANEPYMIYVPEGLSEAKTINGVTIVEGTPSKTSVSGIDFIGSYDALTNIPASDGSNTYYFVSDNKLWKTAESGTADTMQGTRAYFKVPGTSAARLRGFVIDSNNTTGISSVATTSQRTEEDYYDLQGRRVKSPKRGLYIVNGKKMVVK